MHKFKFDCFPVVTAAICLSASHWVNAQTIDGVGSIGATTATTAIMQEATQSAPVLMGDADNAADQSSTLADEEINTSTEAEDYNAQGKRRGEAAQISQFQRFVQQATGQLLPLYGSSLFANPQTFRVDSSAPVPGNHIIGQGDEIKLQIWGGVEYAGSLTVDRNGQVHIPQVGTFLIAGTPAAQVEQVLRREIGKNFTNFQLSTSMGKLEGIQIYVVGQARKPGSYTLSSLSTLANALFASGGPSAQGSMRHIQLKRRGQLVTTLDLYEFISQGDKNHDVTLQAGDVIVIPPVGPQVAVTGALDQAAIYELKTAGSSTVQEILGLGGGMSVLASTHKALIERIDPTKTPAHQVENLLLDAQGMQSVLRDGDIVTLLGISPAFANAVTLQGNVAAPLRYQWFEGMKIRDLIPETNALITSDYYQRKNILVQSIDESQTKGAGKDVEKRVRSMVDQINWDYAVVERLDKKQLKTQLISFNLGRAILQGDETQNLTLEPGDVVTILSEKDLKLPADRQTRLIRVEGEVIAPGLYEIQPGETMVDLIQRIGGVTPQAYLYGMQISRNSVRARQQENLNLLIRRLETQQQSEILYLMANRSSSDAGSSAALMQQQQQLTKTRIDALRKLQSNGRITLELNPDGLNLASLPDLPLEDGDRIMIPATPGFISAMGAINNENVFIYKPGRTVGEILKVAGLREEADKKEIFILRADGSIVGNATAGWFGSINGLKLMPGDTIVVPEKMDKENNRNFVMRQFKDITQILSQFGLGVAAIKAIKNL